MKDLYIIFNERVYYNNKNYFCENKDIQSIVNYLSHKYSLIIISRYSAFVRPFKLNTVSKFFYFRLAKIFNFFIFLFNFTKEKKKNINNFYYSI